ncbi:MULTISPECIES: CinA family nicotinamide mononucleotide deamidase-related protein [unclassified Staphylococcus]|uniref:CinA family nicotinamide mononucleotide deamidase-related protein n=1 Tax=unclassified Staphylococcus TaxID=91994 RepID=UPI0021D39F05|nr:MULTISPECIES: CinA family nicotinamide mononucleotide deamidase-related protein [unclassified Staphylococcus]UXR77490.1 CinA family nicotinamide mononucleotide deamidase-related protein [Staphylococcus sp. IVB6227]UXR83368.1 CinA family nicotinamide mononucleotide deamidase-related protein [Staphylococcus sp. IVB6214]
MKVCIIGVGSELLLGQIANTNAQYISRVLNEAGHHVLEHIVVGDNPDRLRRVTERAIAQYDAVIFTGGLGPTKDDLTKQTVAEVMSRQLVMDYEALAFIESYFASQDKVMTPNNKQQALVIEGSDVLANRVGMAPGMYIVYDDTHIVMLPGPPSEMKPMVDNEMMPFFVQSNQTIFSEVLRFCGIGESQAETELLDLIDAQTNPTIAPLAGKHEVTIRLTASGKNTEICQQLIAPIKTEILSRIGTYYYGSDNIKPEEAVMHAQQETVAVYDAVTDGYLNARLKQADQQNRMQGYMLHHSTYIDMDVSIEDKVRTSALFVQSLFETTQAVSLFAENETVYIGFLDGQSFEMKNFKMASYRNLIRDRSQNYVLIEWLRWLQK